MRLPSTQQKVAFLRAAPSWRDGARRIEVIETHFAWVFLTRRHAYKLRKPLRHGQMDYRTLARRRRGCLAEVALNRRLAPGIYLGVVPMTWSRAATLRLGGTGRVVDYLVKMRRLPATRMLDAVLVRRAARTSEMRALLDLLGTFFDAARPRPLAGRACLARLRRQMRANQAALLQFTAADRSLIDRVHTLQRRAYRRLRGELAARGARLVDGHGDLRPEHCCTRPAAVIDCIEFDAGLRRLDPLEELAFLALEIERLRQARAAWALLRQFRDRHSPAASDALLHFYMSHRAATRAMLSAWHVGDPQFPDPRPWRARTRDYLRRAARHAGRALAAK